MSVKAEASPPTRVAIVAGVLCALLATLPRLAPLVPVLALPLSIAGLFAALPLLVTRLYGRFFHALLALFVAILLISVIGSTDLAIAFAVLFGLWALVAGEVLARRHSVVSGCAAGLLVLCLEAALATAAEGPNAMEESLRSPQMQAAFDQWATQAQLSQTEAKETVESVRSGILALYPALSVVSAALIVALNAIALGRLVGRLHKTGFTPGELTLLRWPFAIVIAFVVSGALLLLPEFKVAAWNGLVVTLFLFLLQGLSVMTFALVKVFSSEFRRVLFVVGSLLGPWAILLSLLGLFDQWFDFRSRFASREAPPAPTD